MVQTTYEAVVVWQPKHNEWEEEIICKTEHKSAAIMHAAKAFHNRLGAQAAIVNEIVDGDNIYSLEIWIIEKQPCPLCGNDEPHTHTLD